MPFAALFVHIVCFAVIPVTQKSGTIYDFKVM